MTRCYIKRIINDFVHAMGARNMALIARFATGLFNAALRALLNRPVAQLANRAIFVPIAFTIIDYSFIVYLYNIILSYRNGNVHCTTAPNKLVVYKPMRAEHASDRTIAQSDVPLHSSDVTISLRCVLCRFAH